MSVFEFVLMVAEVAMVVVAMVVVAMVVVMVAVAAEEGVVTLHSRKVVK